MRTLAGAAEAAWWCLRLTEVKDLGQRAVELTQQVDDPRSEVLARHYLQRALASTGDAEAARRQAEAMLGAAERLRDPGRLAPAFARNLEWCFFRGELEDARSFAERGLGTFVEPLGLLSTLAVLEYEAGDFVRGSAIFDRVMDVRRRGEIDLAGFV